MFGAAAPISLVFGFYGEESNLSSALRDAIAALNPVELTTITLPDVGRAYPLLLASLRSTWCLDPFLSAVADDVLETPLLVGLTQRCVVAPYDGGVDLILRDRVTRDLFAERFASWRAPHRKGL